MLDGMPPGRPRDLDARGRILAAAAALLDQGGADGATIDAIARRAGVGKQTIYRWWPSRSAVVLDALVTRSLDATPMPVTADARDDFRRHLAAVVDLFASPAGALLREMLGSAQRDPDVGREFVDRYWAPRREVSLQRFTAAQASGQIRPDLDPAVSLDVLHGALWLRLLIPHAPLDRRVVDQVVSAVWESWRP